MFCDPHALTPKTPTPGKVVNFDPISDPYFSKHDPHGPPGGQISSFDPYINRPPKTPNRPPRGSSSYTHRAQGIMGFFSLQWKNGGPEWPLNRGSDPPNNFFRLLGSNGAPRWGDVRLSVFFTGKRFAFYKYPMLTVSSRLVWLDEKQTLWKLLFLSFPISFFRIKGATFHFILQASWLTFCKKW